MATESWVIDGKNLSNQQYKIAMYEGMDDGPAVMGDNIDIPFRAGSVWTPKSFGEAKRTLTILLLNRDPSTGIPPAAQDAQRALVDTALDDLMKLFGQRHRLLTIVRTLSGGAVRQGYAEVVDTISPNQLAVNSAAFVVGLKFPQPFWEDQADQTYNAPVPAVTATTYTPAAFAAATAPMEDLVVTITGPCTNPKLLDVASGYYFQYNGSLTGGQTMVVNSKLWTVTGTGGFSPSMANFVHTGGRLFSLTPDYINGAQVIMTFTGGSGATTFSIVGRRRYIR